MWISELTRMGNTDAVPAVLNSWLSHAEKHGASANGVFVRRRFVQLDAVQAHASEIFPAKGAIYERATATWTFPGGATLKLRHVFNSAAAEELQGQNFSMIIMGGPRDWIDNSVLMKLSYCLSQKDDVTPKLISFSEN